MIRQMLLGIMVLPVLTAAFLTLRAEPARAVPVDQVLKVVFLEDGQALVISLENEEVALAEKEAE